MYFVFGILIILGLLAINFYFTVGYGSFGGFLAEQRSFPKEEKLYQLRNDAITHLTQAHSELSSLSGLTFYEKTYSDMCAKGEHGWKRSDSFAYLCSYRLTYYYGINEDYKEFLLKMEKNLNDLGWSIQIYNPPQPTISESINQYPGDVFTAELPIYMKRFTENYNFFDKYNKYNMYLRINNFPGYYSGWSELDKEPEPFDFGLAIGQVIYKNQSDISPNEIFSRISSAGQQRIMVVISQEYFQN